MSILSFVACVIVGGLFGFIFGLQRIVITRERNRSRQLLDQNNLLKAHIEEYQQQFLRKLHNSLYDFFDGSPINHYVIKLNKDGLTINIGDDEDMIAVDMEDFRENPPAALERAKWEWMERR